MDIIFEAESTVLIFARREYFHNETDDDDIGVRLLSKRYMHNILLLHDKVLELFWEMSILKLHYCNGGSKRSM